MPANNRRFLRCIHNNNNWASEVSPTLGCSIEISRDILHTSPLLTVHFHMTRSVRYQPIFNGLKFTLHLARVLNNVVITTVVEMIEMVEILDGRIGKLSVERVRYVINNLLSCDMESFH